MSWSVSAAGTGAASWQSSSPSEFALPRDIGGGKILILAWGVDYHYTTPSGSLYQVLIRVIVVHGYGCMSIQGYSGKGAKVLPYFFGREKFPDALHVAVDIRPMWRDHDQKGGGTLLSLHHCSPVPLVVVSFFCYCTLS